MAIDREAVAEVWAPRFLSILRIVTALIFFEHGSQKLLGFPPRSGGNYPAMFSMSWVGAIASAPLVSQAKT